MDRRPQRHPPQSSSSPKGKILRPFLQHPPRRHRGLPQTINQPWREDSTNSDTAFTRNHIRHELPPPAPHLKPQPRPDPRQPRRTRPRRRIPLADRTKPPAPSAPAPRQTRPWRRPRRQHHPGDNPPSPSNSTASAPSTPPSAAASSAPPPASSEPASASTKPPVSSPSAAFVPIPTVAARTGATLQLSNHLRADRSPRELRLFRQQ